MLRLPKRHSRNDNENAPKVEATDLLAQQRLGQGLLLSCIAAVVVMASWVWLGMAFDRHFPWFSMLQGIVIGRVMRHAGRGIDWRFPAAAAAVTAFAAMLGDFLAALFLTGREFGTGPYVLISEISLHTLRTFFTRDFGVVGVIYMAFAAVLAAFYANRRLQRDEAIALRRFRERG